MLVEMRDDKTIVIRPKSTAELVALKGFEKATVEVEKPTPFEKYVDVLLVRKAEK